MAAGVERLVSTLTPVEGKFSAIPNVGNEYDMVRRTLLGCLDAQEIDLTKPLEIGVDVARYGDDHTVAFVRRGNVVLERVSYNGNATTYTWTKLSKPLTATSYPASRPRA
jgi:hypothetical protein